MVVACESCDLLQTGPVGAAYWLHPTREGVDSYALRYGGLRVVLEAKHLGSVAVGDPVGEGQVARVGSGSGSLRCSAR